MPPTPADLEAYRRIAREEAVRAAREETARLAGRVANHSGQLKAVQHDIREELSPAAARRISEAEFKAEDRSLGFEKLMLDSLEASRRETAEVAAKQDRLEAKVDFIGQSVPPTANRTEGKADALIKGQEQQDAAIQKTDKKSTATLVGQALTLALAIATIVERILHAAGSP